MIIQKSKNMFVAKERGLPVAAVIASCRHVVRVVADNLGSTARQQAHKTQVTLILNERQGRK